MAKKGYLTTKDLCDRFQRSRFTLDRWMKREINPLPKPITRCAGANNLWAIDDIEKWEESSAQQSAA